MKPTVYIETTIPSYLTAWPSGDLIRAAEQRQTKLWWETRGEYEFYGSELLIEECGDGDPAAAAERLIAIRDLPVLKVVPRIGELADLIVRDLPLPKKAVSDAYHIATATYYGLDLLVSWNCRHIANIVLRPKLIRICRNYGYEPPDICTPAALLGALHNERD